MSSKSEEELEESADKKDSGEVETNMTEYCKNLETWLWKAYCQRAVATSAYFTALNSYYGVNSNQAGGAAPMGNGSLNNNNYLNLGQFGPAHQHQQRRNDIPWQHQQPQQQQQQQQQQAQRPPQFQFMFPAPGGGVVVKIAPIWKRLLAECIDFLILLLVKLFVTFTVIDSFDLIDLDSIDLDSLRADAAGDTDQLQGLYDIAFSLTSELILLELTHRIVVCFFEGYCLWKTGGTPGKTLLGLRVVHAEDVLPFVPRNNNNNQQQQLPPQLLWDLTAQTAVVRPGCFMTFPRAFLRSALKNFSLAFFFPLCFTLFHFDYSRTLYDLMAKSIVIEV